MLAMILVPLLVQNLRTSKEAEAFTATDTPGDGFDAGDDCGFVMGSADSYGTLTVTGRVNFSVIADTQQGCVDENQYFYSSSTRESYGRYAYTSGGVTTNYVMDFDYSATSNVFLELDPSGDYWTWTGAARIVNGTIPSAQRWVDFEWTCADVTCSSGLNPEDYYVRTDTRTGVISGYAWNDYVGNFISFNSSTDALVQELPPRSIVTYVDILANETTDGPDDVDYTDAPLADGAAYWRVRVQFLDQTTGQFLDADDIDELYITPVATSDSLVRMNQVENSGDAIETSYMNSYMEDLDPTVDCTSAYETDFTQGCILYESDGSTSFNKFIYSGAPTSNVLGLNDDTDAAIEYPSDRDGCRWIYYSQYAEVDMAARSPCPPAPLDDDKADVFYERETDRNKYEIDYVTVNVTFTWEDTEVEMYTYGTAGDGNEAFVTAGLIGDTWNYYFADGTSDLSYRPRYQINKFVAVYDGSEYTTISDDVAELGMNLKTEAVMSDTSLAYQSVIGAARPNYRVYYQLDADSSGTDMVTGDRYLLMDTDYPSNSPTSGDVEETYRRDDVTSSLPYYTAYNRAYAMAYGQKASYLSTCGTPGFSACVTPTNTLSNPTAEQWVCDDATEQTMGEESCYYTEYLPHIDRHQEPESMFVIGAINSIIDADEVLEEISNEEGTVLSTLGTTETINLRNKMYAQGLLYTRMYVGTASSGSFDSSGEPSSGLVELMNGRLVFAQGDVTIDGFDGSDKTLFVLGGDVFINTNIENGRMGIIAFKRDGVGGNVYIDNEVTDLWANFFLDGSLFSYNGIPPSTVYPTWTSDEERVETLANQLHLKGSLVSRNTVNGADGSAPYDLGDGTTTDTFGVAREYDLNLLRQYRMCYGLNADGTLDTSVTEECGDGALLSDYGADNGYYNSFILEYSPAEGLPIFTVESGLFN